MKKLITLTALLLCAVVSTWALDSGTENSGNQGSSYTTISGKSYSLDGRYIAGKGGVKQGNMPDKGVKMRSNQGNLVFEVADGYKITAFQFWGCGNTTTAVTIESATVDGGSNLLTDEVVLPGKGNDESGDINLSDINAQDNITLTFAEGSSAQIVGTWSIEYEQTAVVVKEITEVKLNGSAISNSDLATLKSTKALTIDGTSLNGCGALDVTLSSGATTVSKTFSGTSAVYTFSVDEDEYTVTVTKIAKTYSGEGTFVYFKKGSTQATGTNTNTVMANGITFAMVDTGKEFQSGSAKVTIGEDEYTPLKLSTGSAVNVTFPENMVATKVRIYGWSANGNGAINSIKETSESTVDKSIDTHNDIFYATNTSGDIYPSVYEYTLDNWTSFYFNPVGSASQPFVVMEFVLRETVTIPVSAAGYATFYTDKALDFTGIKNITAYTATKAGNIVTFNKVTDAVPALTGLLVKADEGNYPIPVAASAEGEKGIMVGTLTGETIPDGSFVLLNQNDVIGFYRATGFTARPNSAWLPSTVAGSSVRFIGFDDEGGEATGIQEVSTATMKSEQVFNLRGQRVAAPQKGLYIVNGKKVILK